MDLSQLSAKKSLLVPSTLEKHVTSAKRGETLLSQLQVTVAFNQVRMKSYLTSYCLVLAFPKRLKKKKQCVYINLDM